MFRAQSQTPPPLHFNSPSPPLFIWHIIWQSFAHRFFPFRAREQPNDSEMMRHMIQARKRHININFFVRLVLGRPQDCPWDKPGLSQGQIRWKPGTHPDFFLILHSGSPISPSLSLGQTRFVPGTIPGTKGGTESLCEKSLCAFLAR